MKRDDYSNYVGRVFAIVLALALAVPMSTMFSSYAVAETTNETTITEIPDTDTIPEEEIPPFIPPTIPPFERVEEPYNITLVEMDSPTGPLYEGYRKPIQVILKNKGDHNIFNINVDIYDQLEDNEPVFLTDLFYGCIPKGKEQTKTFTWEPETGTHSLTLNISFTDNGLEQWNEEEFGFYVMPEEASTYENIDYTHHSYQGPNNDWTVEHDTTLVRRVEITPGVFRNQLILDEGQPPSGTTYIFFHQADIIVKNGATLILDGTQFPIICPTDGQYSITVDGGGLLEIQGESLITATQSDLTYGFVVSGTLNVQGTSDTVRSKIHWTYGDITNAENPGGIQLYAGVGTFDYAEIKQGRSHNIWAYESILTLTNTNVLEARTDFIGCGIYAIGGTVVNIQNSNLSDNAHSGMYSTSVKTEIDGLEAWDNLVGVYLKDTGGLNPLKKPYYEPGIDLGYYIWVDDNPLPETWHIRWSGEGAAGPMHTYEGLIYTSKPVIDIDSYDFEIPSDSYTFTPPYTISFMAEERIYEDGIDFTLSEPGDVMFWDLSIDGAVRQDLAFVGAGGGSPTDPIFGLWHQPTISNSKIMRSGITTLQPLPCEVPVGQILGVALDNSAAYIHDVDPVSVGNIGLYSYLASPIIEFCNFSSHIHPGIAIERGSPAILNNMLYKNSHTEDCGWEPQIGVVECGGIIKGNYILGNLLPTRGPGPGPGLDYLQTGIVAMYSTTRIESNIIKNHYQNGMFLSDYSGVVISNDVSVGPIGIQLIGGDNALLDSNIIYDFGSGVQISGTNSRVHGNTIDSSIHGGLSIYNSDNIEVSENTISSNGLGINMWGSSNVMVYHNNILFNTEQAYDDGANSWDNGYPSGGNYWSDYTGMDFMSGPLQDQPGSDGIGDTPYTDQTGQGIQGDTNVDNYPLMDPSYLPWSLHGPIRIDSNWDMLLTASAEGWSGKGLSDNPFIIEKYIIDGTDSGNCVYIGNTTYHFEVRNCLLQNGNGGFYNTQYYYDTGLYLHNVQNGNVVNNIVTSNGWLGIYVETSENNIISDNSVYLNLEGEGIRLDWYSNVNTVTNNVINRNNDGIFVIGFSSANTIAHNNIHAISGGILVGDGAVWNHVEYNEISNEVQEFGISLTSVAANNYVEYNTISGCHQGIHINWSHSNIINENTISDSSDYGIYFHHSDGNTFTGNTLTLNNYGIYATLTSTSNQIYNNNFIDNANQAYDDSTWNSWNAAYPTGGNYWSDFDEPGEGAYDYFHGPNQMAFGSDGIVDVGLPGGLNPYFIPGGSAQDTYPLIDPWEP